MANEIGSGGFDILLAHPGHAERIVREAAAVRAQELANLADNLRGAAGAGPIGGYRVEQRTALIPVYGPLVPRGPVVLSRYGVTSYEALRAELRRAGTDDDVDTIVLMVDSPGGYVNGLDATADAVLATRERKPVMAVVEGMAASAAYWLASQADTILISPFSSMGSIGALMVHVEISRALDAAGIKVTIVRAGARKAEGSPFEPLSDDATAAMQASVDDLRTAFATAVVAGRARPELDLDAVMATEAAMFDARPAAEMGLADRIGTLDQVLDRLPDLVLLARRQVVRPIAVGTLSDLTKPAREIPDAAVSTSSNIGNSDPVSQRGLSDVDGPSPAIAGNADSMRAEERARVAAIFAHPFAATPPGRIYAESLAASDKEAPAAIAELDRFAKFLAEHEKTIARAASLSLDDEMAADAMPIIAGDGGSTSELTAMEHGALAGARAKGKDPNLALATIRGTTPAIDPAATPIATSISPESADLLRKLRLAK